MDRPLAPDDVRDLSLAAIASTAAIIATMQEAIQEINAIIDRTTADRPRVSETVPPWKADPLSVAVTYLQHPIAECTPVAEAFLHDYLRAGPSRRARRDREVFWPR
jgi:hypothetical protein